jgi:hypothetical protein
MCEEASSRLYCLGMPQPLDDFPQSVQVRMMKKIVLCSSIALLMAAGSASAEDAAVAFQCQVAAQEAGPSQSEPFSIEIRGSAVKLAGVSALDGGFSLIRKNDAFYVFKNGKGQGGNINRANGVVELYAVNAASHKMTVSITGTCVKQE